MDTASRIRVLMICFIMVAGCFATMANGAETQALVCIDQPNQTLIFADGSKYKLLDGDCKNLCPRGLPASLTVEPRQAMSAGPVISCYEITNSLTQAKVLAVQVNIAESKVRDYEFGD